MLELRQELNATSALGEYGAVAVACGLEAEVFRPPTMRTINRVLARSGAVEARQRVRQLAPPPGWYFAACRRRPRGVR